MPKERKFQMDILNDGITSREASILILRTKIKELNWNLAYWERYGRLATNMMTPDQIADFWRRMEYITQLEGNIKGMEAVNAQLAAEIASLPEPKKEPTTKE